MECDNSRGASAKSIYEISNSLLKKTKWNIIENGNIKNTVSKIVKESNTNDVVLICGSFYIMADARKVLGYHDCTD